MHSISDLAIYQKVRKEDRPVGAGPFALHMDSSCPTRLTLVPTAAFTRMSRTNHNETVSQVAILESSRQAIGSHFFLRDNSVL